MDDQRHKAPHISVNQSASRSDSAESDASDSLSDGQISPDDMRSALPRRIKTKTAQWQTESGRGEVRGFLVTSRKREQHRIFPTPILSRNTKENEADEGQQSSEHWLERQIYKKPKICADACQVDMIPDFESEGESTLQEQPSQEKYTKQELEDFLNFCKFISSEWTPELNGPLMKGAKMSSSGCRQRALNVLNSCEGNITLAKFKIMFPMAELVQPSILQKLSRQDLERSVADGERKFREEKETAKEVLINEMARMLKNRVRENELKEFMQEHQVEEHEIPTEVLDELNEAQKVTEKIEGLPSAGIPMEQAEGMIEQSRSVKVITKTMEDFESEWNRALALSQKIKELNSGAVTLRGVQAIIKEKKNLQIWIEGASELKAALGRAQKWFSRASGFFKRPKPRSSQMLLPTSHLEGGQESVSLIRSEGSSNLDELIEEAGRLELQCLDVVKTQRELLSLRDWERRVRMVLEDPKEQCRQQTLESLVEEGQQMKGQIPLLDELLRLQDRVKWEQKTEILLAGKGTKIKKLENLLDQGEQKRHTPVLLRKLKELHRQILRLQDRVTELLAQCNDRRGKASYEELSELMDKCEELPVNVPAKHALGRKLHELENWVRKARSALGGTRESAKLNQLKQLLEDWSQIRISVKEEQHLRSLVFPTQGFIEKMKKCARRYQKQAQILQQNKQEKGDIAPMTMSTLLAYERRPCAYEECVGLVEEAPEIVKQDMEYQALLELLQQAVEWEKDMLALFEHSPLPVPEIKEGLMQYRRVPAKRSVVSHLMRLYLVHEWKAKVIKLAGSTPFNVLHLLLEEGRQLWSESTRSPIEQEIKSLEEKVQRVAEWMQLKKELQSEEEERGSFTQAYYSRLSHEAHRLGLSGTCDAVCEIEQHHAQIQEWKGKAHILMRADVKSLTELELLEQEYQDLEVEIPAQEAALQTLLQLFHFWTHKVRIALSARCGLMNEYRLRVVVQIPQNSECKILIFPGEEEEDANQYCICRSQECLLKMVACDRCNEWFHVQCLLNLQDVDSVRLRSLHNEDFICPLCEKRYAQYYRPQHQNPPTLLSPVALDELLEQGQQMSLSSPETELLRYLISKVKQHKELVEAELNRELEILPLPGLEEIKKALGVEEGKVLKVQKSIEMWKERNKFLEQLYLQSMGLPVQGEEMRIKLLRFLRARDWIEKFYFLSKHEPSKNEKEVGDKYTQLLSSEGLRLDAKHSEALLAPIVKVLAMLFNSSGETSREVQEMVMNGGKASEARKLLMHVELKGINTFHTIKLKKLLAKYEEWAEKVRGISSAHKVKSMAFIEQLIEDGMYLYLYEDESDQLTSIHAVANKWLEDARAVIISASSSGGSKVTAAGINELLTRYNEEVSVEFKEVEKLRELKTQLSN